MAVKQFIAYFALLTFAAQALADQPAGEVDFAKDVQPILIAKCVRCHGPDKRESGLRLDLGAGLLQGGDNGPAIVAGNAKESLLLAAITGTSELVSQMPVQGEPLTIAEVATLRCWINGGANIPADVGGATKKSSHWAFQQPIRPPLPSVTGRLRAPSTRGREIDIPAAQWLTNPIDSFIIERLQREGVAPSPEAPRATLIRRAALDLTGVPPSPEEVDAFVSDRRPDTYERLIDRLLASPHYGERWGRHWLDLARYADSNGYTHDHGREIWKYRDWVINSINRNQPFNEFTIEQIAGDMLPQASEEQLVATGFHRNTLINEEGGIDKEQFRIESVVDRVNTTASVWLGLTLGCARCHSHKYDPITQQEYFQFFALLNNCDEPVIDVPSQWQREQGELQRRDQIRTEIQVLNNLVESQRPELEEKQRQWEATITPQQQALLEGPLQTAFDMPFDKRDKKNKKLLEDYFRQTEIARGAFPLLAQIFALREAEPKIPTTMILRERSEPRPTYVHRRGDFLSRGPDVTGGVPAVLPPLESAGQRATRLHLARWLVCSSNPLTPRVVMNRDWQKFFGSGIVETEDDFGMQVSQPSHPKLLDWLAVDFVEGGTRWDVKRMHRQIVTSATYRQSSSARRDLVRRDPQNKLLARQLRLRLDAEVVRDVALAASGLLTQAVGGPSVCPPQPEGVFDFTQRAKPWIEATGGDRHRRGMYTHFWRSSPYPMLLAFDGPSGNVTCTRRLRSNTPLQSLTLANDQTFFECAQALAARVLGEESLNDIARAKLAFRLCNSRSPTPAECQRLALLVSDENAVSSGDRRVAWTRICRILLNLDETITRE